MSEDVTSKLEKQVRDHDHDPGRRSSVNKSQEGGEGLEGPVKDGGLYLHGGR